MWPSLNLLTVLPTAIPWLPTELSNLLMAMRLCLTAQGFSKDTAKVPWPRIFSFYSCIFVFWILESCSSTEVLLQLQVRLLERTEMVAAASSGHSCAPSPTLLLQGWKNGMEAPWESDTQQGEQIPSCLWGNFKLHHQSAVSDTMESSVARLNAQRGF